MILDFESALALTVAHSATLSPPRETQTLPLAESLNRILATAITADRDQPAFNRSTRDGFATHSAVLNSHTPVEIIGTLKAGDVWTGPPLTPGHAIEIMTGAPIPPGADAVVMVEHVTRTSTHLTPQPTRTWSPGENIVPQGSEALAGQVVIPAGTLITPAEIALAAACGQAHLTVFRRPRVAIIATGDELVELGTTTGLAPQHIWNSNSHALTALVTAAGAEPIRLPITPDTREAVAASLAVARQYDLIVFSGGVSMGQYDLVEEVLLAAHATFHFTGVLMQPGKPVVFGALPSTSSHPATYLFGLPGNPISTQVTFHCFVEPFLRTLAGATPPQTPRWALASLAHPETRKPALTRLLPARLEGTQVSIVGWQGSGDLAANARANCYAELPAATPNTAMNLPAGTILRILLR